MPSVFIVRPFGKKQITIDKDGKDTQVQVNFDQVDKVLIQPALARNGLAGQTTGVIAQAGNIRLDMFQMLVAHDLVIADISVENANVFYELGIRHGLRRKGTILLRFSDTGKDVPFDLKTDRYILYDRENPAAAVDLLAASIRETISAMRSGYRAPDSPVFLLLPELKAPDPEKLVVVPRDFREAVEKAERDPLRGPTTLALLAEEAKQNSWARPGVRLIGRAQRRMQSFKAARESWQFIRKDLPDDAEANLQLGTIFQRLGDLVSASQACQRVLDTSGDRNYRGDAYSQLARNAKASWVAEFKKLTSGSARREQAISDSRLVDAFNGYMAGFFEDLNDYYSGINALGLLTVIVRLADAEPDVWAGNFGTEEKAKSALAEYQAQLDQLRGAVRSSLDSARRRAELAGKPDEWLPPSEAQYALLTAKNPAFVKRSYMAAKNGPRFSVGSEAAQVAIFFSLTLFPDNCRAALEALGIAADGLDGTSSSEGVAANPPRNRILVATGHRVDAPNRPPPGRFPNTPACIEKVKTWLREKIEAEKAQTKGAISGLAGAASGTDLLFHEVCAELGIPTTVVLPIPKQDYCRESVADGGADWVGKFQDLIATNPPAILSDNADLPPWAESIPSYSVFQRGNIWMMEDALIRSEADVTLLALWNGKAGDGPGGTADMVKLAEVHGAKVCKENTNTLFGLQ